MVAKKKNTTAEMRRHWDRVANLNCIISGRPFPQLHHIHGSSAKEAGVVRGMGQKPSDWLVIPLAYDFHVGDQGIDNGMARTAGGQTLTVKVWEEVYGKQADMLDRVCLELGVNCWKKAGIDREVEGLQ